MTFITETPKTIKKRQKAIEKIYQEQFGKPNNEEALENRQTTRRAESKSFADTHHNDEEILKRVRKAKNWSKFKELMDGGLAGNKTASEPHTP
jgi:hypothetical protein